MTDIIKSKDSAIADPLVRYKDMGDGTHAEVIVVVPMEAAEA